MGNQFNKYTYIFQILFALVLYTIMQETMYFIFSLFHGVFNENSQLIPLLALIAAAGICIPIYYKWYRYHIRFKKHIVIKEALSSKNVTIICITGITINLFLASLIELFNITSYFPKYEDSIGLLVNGNIIVSSILVIFIGPICEELLHRGIAYEYLKANMNKKLANFFQAALFGIVHGDLLQMLYAFVLGLLLGYIYEKYKSIYAPILTHGLFNATSIINSYLFREETAANNQIMIVVCVISGVVLFLGIDQMKKSPTIEYIPEPGVKMINLKELQ